MRRIGWLWLLLVPAACKIAPNDAQSGATAFSPNYVRAADSARVNTTTPADSAAVWLLAHLDIETTGLVPAWHEAVDLGEVLTDLAGNVIDSLFLRIMPDHPERLAPGAAAVNAFSVERWRELGAISRAAAVDSLFAFQRRAAGGRPTMLVAFNSQFDTSFLDELLRASGHSWRELFHYFVLDIPSMAWIRGYRDLNGEAMAELLGVPDEPRTPAEHTGLTGAMLNVRIYQALQRSGCAPTSGPPPASEVTSGPPVGVSR